MQLQPEKQKRDFGFDAWQFFLIAGTALVVYVANQVLGTNPIHRLGIGGTVLVFMGVVLSGIGITTSYRKDALDMLKLKDIQDKLQAEKHSPDVLHGKLDELLNILMENAKDRKSSGFKLKYWYMISLVASAFGTALLVNDLLQ